MAFNRNKILAKAQKLLQKGKITDAIKEYQLVVDNDPSDVRTLLKVGDLQAKAGNIEAANDTYRKVGEHYAKDGFFLKAVAVFKQILKLDPGLISVYLRLAELYQQLGLNSEAMKQYQVVVRHYENQGLKKESLDVLRKMSELDPDNTASKVKLAELYAKEGHNEAAVEQLRSVASGLQEKGNFQDLARVYEKMEAMNVADTAIRLELSEIYLRTAEPKRALAKLQELFQEDAKNPQTLELLARSFNDLQQPEKATSVFKELVGVLGEKGRLEERDRILGKLKAMGVTVKASAAAAPTSEAEEILDELEIIDDEAEAAEPPEEEAPKKAVRAQKPTGSSQAAKKLVSEIDTFLKYGLVDKACETLAKVFAESPGENIIRDKMVEAFQKKGDVEGLGKALQGGLEAAQAQKLTAVATEIEQLIATHAPAVRAVESAEAPSPEPSADTAEESMDMEIVDDEAPERDAAAEAAADASLAEMEGEFERPDAASEPLSLDDVDLSAGLDEEEPGEKTAFEPKVDEAVEEPVAEEIEISLDEVEAAVNIDIVESEIEEAVSMEAEPEEEDEDEGDAFAAEMEEANFFVDEGLLEEAREIYETILSQDADFQPAREKLAELDGASPAKPKARTAEGKKERRSTARAPKESIDLDEPAAAEIPLSRVVAEKEAEADDGGALFDLSTELQDEIAELEEELIKKEPGDEDEYLSPEEVISEFKKGVARTVAKDDYPTHYNLGIAYKEMGLLNEAIQEFEIAQKSDGKISIDAASMIGLCYVGARDFVKAIEVYRKAIAHISPKAPEALGLSFELAEAYIGHGSVVEAYKLFARVKDIDPTFRDVRRRVKELEADLGSSAPHPSAPEKEEKEKSDVEIKDKKNKISYI